MTRVAAIQGKPWLYGQLTRITPAYHRRLRDPPDLRRQWMVNSQKRLVLYVARRSRLGFAAIVFALIAASVVAIALRQRSPLEPIADQIMNLTPVQIAIPLLLTLGSLSRPLALLGGVAVSLVVGGALAVLLPGLGEYGRDGGIRLESMLRAACALLALVLWTVVVLPSGNAVVAGTEICVYVASLVVLGRPVRYSSARREFLVYNARMFGGIAVLVGLLYASPLVEAFRANEAGKELFRWRPPGARKSGFDLAGLTSEVTATDGFYTMDEDLAQPDVDLAGWSLSVGGLVQRSQNFRFNDLLGMRRHDQIVTQECVSNPVGGPLMSTAMFSGVPVRVLLARSGLVPGAQAVLFRSPDGHEEALPLTLALDPRVMLVYAADGHLLQRAHGFPVRLLVPGFYGYKSVKWVESMQVTTDPSQGYWAREGWNPLPEVKTTARIDLARAANGETLVAGVAFAGRRGIKEVHVRVNGGPWRNAEVHTPPLSPLTWVQWRVSLPERGSLTLEARAIDGTGQGQTATRQTQKPDGASGYDVKRVTV